eukprot:COSAG01_NODE_29665_length_632_cov_1.514071_1_plen_36_part_01
MVLAARLARILCSSTFLVGLCVLLFVRVNPRLQPYH